MSCYNVQPPHRTVVMEPTHHGCKPLRASIRPVFAKLFPRVLVLQRQDSDDQNTAASAMFCVGIRRISPLMPLSQIMSIISRKQQLWKTKSQFKAAVWAEGVVLR